jgi:prepilin-type N-terminal cleavage/methylation domain-containing protein
MIFLKINFFAALRRLVSQSKERIAGFTLIESIVTIAIFTVLILVVTNFIYMLYRTQGYTFEQSQAINEARKGIETMVKEIREAQMAENGAYVIEKADDYEFIFYSDINKDLSVEKIRYFIDGSDFKKGITEPTPVNQLSDLPAKYLPESEQVSVLSSFVRNSPPVFHYYDGNGNELPAPARKKDTKLMKVYLVINVSPSRAPDDFVLESEVQIRNIKDNL